MGSRLAAAFAAAALFFTTAADAADIILVRPGPDGTLAPALDMNAATFIPGSRLVLAAGPGPVAGAFSATTGEQVVDLSGIHRGFIYVVTYVTPYQRLATAATDGRLIFWDRVTGEGLSEVRVDAAIGAPIALEVATDNSILVIAGFDGIQVYTERDNSYLVDVSGIGTVVSAQLTEAGRQIVVVGNRATSPEIGAPWVQRVYVYDVASQIWTSGPLEPSGPGTRAGGRLGNGGNRYRPDRVLLAGRSVRHDRTPRRVGGERGR